MLRVASVDDHEIVRAGFCEMLADELGISIAFEAASGEEALACLQETPCNPLLLNLALPGQGSPRRHEQLSERELQVFLRLAQGRAVSETGEMLHLSVKTMSTYRARLLEKLGVASHAELATDALRNGQLVD